MKAGALVVSLVLMVVVPAGAQHGGGHFGGLGGGHFGGHFSSHGSRHSSRHWRSGSVSALSGLSHIARSPGLTTFVGFGSTPGFRFFFVSDSFFCPVVPHRVFPFCRFCGLGFFGFSGFGFFDGFGPSLDVYSQPAAAIPPPTGNSQPARAVLVFKNGWAFEVTDYWIDDEGELRYVTTYGGMNIADLQSLDLYLTAKENEARGIPFTLKLRHEQ